MGVFYRPAACGQPVDNLWITFDPSKRKILKSVITTAS
jgi:hypothetical protein